MTETDISVVQDEQRRTDVFLGYHRQQRYMTSKGRFHEGAMTECANMCMEEYPCAAARPRRYDVTNKGKSDGMELRYMPYPLTDAVLDDGKLAYLCADAYSLGEEPRQMIMHGRRVWTANAPITGGGRLLPFGNGFFTTGGIYVPDKNADGVRVVRAAVDGVFDATLCDGDEDITSDTTVSDEAPESPSEGDYWYRDGYGLYLYDGTEWQPVPVFHVQLTADTTGMSEDAIAALKADMASLRADDVVFVRRGHMENHQIVYDDLGAIKVYKVDADAASPYIMLNTLTTPGEYRFDITRRLPVLDHIVVHDNRVWGCRYGDNGYGATVNEIYCCRLGDPTNWYQMDLTESDAFIFTVGEPGPWTGAAVLNDTVVFFKENCMVTVYGDTPSGYRAQLEYCDGVEYQSERSIVYMRGYLYYKSTAGFMRLYSGTLPVRISDALALKDRWEIAQAGTDGSRYYAQMYDMTDRTYVTWVYDGDSGEWQREDSISGSGEYLVGLVPVKSGLFAVTCGETADTLTQMYVCGVRCVSSPAQGVTWELFGNGYETLGLCGAVKDGDVYLPVLPDNQAYPADIAIEVDHVNEPEPEWAFSTGDFGHDAPVYKRIKSVAVRAYCEAGAGYDIDVMFDQNGTWVPLTASGQITGEGTRRVEYRLRRCDLYRFRFRGTGRVVIYGITHTYEYAGGRNYDAAAQNQAVRS